MPSDPPSTNDTSTNTTTTTPLFTIRNAETQFTSSSTPDSSSYTTYSLVSNPTTPFQSHLSSTPTSTRTTSSKASPKPTTSSSSSFQPPPVELTTSAFPSPSSPPAPPLYLDVLPPALAVPAQNLYVLVSTKSGTEKAEEAWTQTIRPLLKVLFRVFGSSQPGRQRQRGYGNDENDERVASSERDGHREMGQSGAEEEREEGEDDDDDDDENDDDENAGSMWTLIRTEDEASVKTFARGVLSVKARKGEKQTMLLLSGDGGVADLVNGVMEEGGVDSTYTRPIIALFPLGTGNALFHSTHQTSSDTSTTTSTPTATPDLTLALLALLHGTPRPLPLFAATFSPAARLLSNAAQTATPIRHHTLYGAVVASYGFHATLVADSDTVAYRRHGERRFGMVAETLLRESHAYRARVVTCREGEEAVLGTRDQHGYVLLTLVSRLEKTFTISPATRPLEGALRVVSFEAMAGEEVMTIMKQAYAGGKHVTESAQRLRYEEVDGLRIEFLEEGEEGTWRRVCVDGTIVRVEEGGWMEVVKMPLEESVLEVLVV